MGCSYTSTDTHLTKRAAKLFASDLRLLVNRERRKSFINKTANHKVHPNSNLIHASRPVI